MLTLIAACAVAVLVARPGSPRSGRRRLERLLGAPVEGGRRASAGPPEWSVRLAGASGAAAAVLTLVGGSSGFALAAAGLVGAWFVLGRLEPRSARRRREVVRRDLPFAVDLLATCLAAGAGPGQAFGVVGDAVGGPLGAALSRTSSVLALGASSLEATAGWAADPALAELDAVGRIVRRAARSGTGLTDPAARLAVDLRADRRWRVDEVARRAGVRATAPLGACFLPAFVLIGIAPVVLWGTRSFTP